jgi:hypothetical protein
MNIRRLSQVSTLALLSSAAIATLTAIAEPQIHTAPTNSTSFIRFVSTNDHAGRVETAVRSYHNPDGVEVTLYSAVHIADAEYYRNLQQRFRQCDALLYEMIRDEAPDDTAPEIDTAHPISQLQIGMKRLLALEFQLDAIDYSASNFVHADLDPVTFLRLQQERNESLLGIMIRLMLEEQARINAGEATPVNSFALLVALMNPDRAYALKLMLGQQMDQLERILAGIDDSDGADGTGSVIVSARNEHAVKVLQEQIAQGRRRLGIFYGAGHMTDFERRLTQLGFQPTRSEWVTAWDIRPRKNTAPGSSD